MPYDISELGLLMDAADEAYRRVRSLIIDPLAGANPDESHLTVCQRWALNELRSAEAALEEYRARNYAYSMISVPEQVQL